MNYFMKIINKTNSYLSSCMKQCIQLFLTKILDCEIHHMTFLEITINERFKKCGSILKFSEKQGRETIKFTHRWQSFELEKNILIRLLKLLRKISLNDLN